MTISERFKAVRKHEGLTQAEFGKALGMSRDTVANIEGDRMPPKDIHILAVCRTFTVSETWLVSGEGEMHAPLSKEQEIAEIAASMFKDDQDSFRYQMIKLIAQMNEEQMKLIKDMAVKLAEFSDK